MASSEKMTYRKTRKGAKCIARGSILGRRESKCKGPEQTHETSWKNKLGKQQGWKEMSEGRGK